MREAVAAADAILCDANLPAAALERLVALAAGKPVFAIAISPAKAVRLAGVLPALACLFMNRREAAALAGVARRCRPSRTRRRGCGRAGLARGVITQGSGGGRRLRRRRHLFDRAAGAAR